MTAIWTGTDSDLKIAERSPDCGNNAPIVSWPLTLPREFDAAVVFDPLELLLLLPHAAAPTAITVTRAIAPQRYVRAMSVVSPGIRGERKHSSENPEMVSTRRAADAHGSGTALHSSSGTATPVGR
ncbi:MAG TPA: hypothetical protein VN636_20200, partial [Acidimicrobiia bacterium]|nr:hypothetical protein [Acidimicrobiia bacterium]